MNADPNRDAAIAKVLPKEPITEGILMPALKAAMTGPLLQCLKKELEIYKAFPKPNAKPDVDTFDPRNNKTCFMGQGFFANSHGTFESWMDVDLEKYRQGVGTIPHPEWGNVTLMEIWAADHFGEYPDMVLGAFEWCYGKRKKLPPLQFIVMPFANKHTGKWKMDDADRKAQEDRENFVENLVDLAYKSGYKTAWAGDPPRVKIEELPRHRRRNRNDVDEDDE